MLICSKVSFIDFPHHPALFPTQGDASAIKVPYFQISSSNDHRQLSSALRAAICIIVSAVSDRAFQRGLPVSPSVLSAPAICAGSGIGDPGPAEGALPTGSFKVPESSGVAPTGPCDQLQLDPPLLAGRF